MVFQGEGPGSRPHFWIPAWFTHSLDPSRCLNFGANAFYHEMSKGGYRSDPVILWGLYPIFAEQIDRYYPVGPCSVLWSAKLAYTHPHGSVLHCHCWEGKFSEGNFDDLDLIFKSKSDQNSISTFRWMKRIKVITTTPLHHHTDPQIIRTRKVTRYCITQQGPHSLGATNNESTTTTTTTTVQPPHNLIMDSRSIFFYFDQTNA